MNVVNRYTGRVFQQNGPLSPGIQHAIQSVLTIITTPILTRFWNRIFGSELPFLIDETINDITKLRIYAAIVIAVERFEDRVIITRTTVNDQDSLQGQLNLNIEMIYIPENRFITLEGIIIQ